MSKEVDDILNEIDEDAILSECAEVVADKMEKIMHEKSIYIYNQYTPYGKDPYKRRFMNGGFADAKNIHSEIQRSGNTVNIDIYNDTLAAGDDSGSYLDEIISDGDRYTWEHHPSARPFDKRALEEIETTNVIEDTIDSVLKAKGYTVK